MTKPLTTIKRNVLVSELAKQADTDLAVAQRPSRTEAGIAKTAMIPYGYGGPQVEVMGPGRGIGWIYVGWLEDEGDIPSLGQVHKDQLVAPPAEPEETP
jgi:hypothetical protein